MNDPNLSFMTTIKAFIKAHSVSPDPSSQMDKDLDKNGKLGFI